MTGKSSLNLGFIYIMDKKHAESELEYGKVVGGKQLVFQHLLIYLDLFTVSHLTKNSLKAKHIFYISNEKCIFNCRDKNG